MADLIVILDFLSRAMAVALAIGTVVGFALRHWIKAALDARFKRQIGIELEQHKHAFAVALEDKKAELTRQVTTDVETLKAGFAKDLEQQKRQFDEQARRDARIYDRRLAFYENFALEYGRVLVELWALQEDFTAPLNTTEHPDLGAVMRKHFVLRAHAMLMQAEQKLDPDAAYVDVFTRKRIVNLFADLSAFIGDGARAWDRLEALSLENGLIRAELRLALWGEP
jgi:hypothetical protein